MARSTVPLLWLAAALLVLPCSVASAQEAEDAEAAAAVPTGGGAFIPPQIILGTQKQPEFPPAAWEARYTGAVLLEMTVLEDGAVGDVKVVRCSHPKVGFEDAAVAAVKQWRFEPGVENGERVAVKTRLKLNFTRVGVGVRAQPQVSAGSFTVESRLSTERGPSSAGFSSSSSGGDRK
jgi:TonB family protein